MFPYLSRGSVESVNVNDLSSLLGRINLIDVREPHEYRSGHLPTARNIPMEKISYETEKYLDKSKEYYIICYSGSRSSRTCSILMKKGYRVINVSGGTGGYMGRLAK